jgi:hypothetical protein
MIGLGLKCQRAAFYGRERLFAHHSVVLSGIAQHSGLTNEVPPKLMAILGRPRRATFKRTTQLVFNDADDVRGRRGSVQEPKGALLYGLPHGSDFLSLRRDNKGRARMVKPIEAE